MFSTLKILQRNSNIFKYDSIVFFRNFYSKILKNNVKYFSTSLNLNVPNDGIRIFSEIKNLDESIAKTANTIKITDSCADKIKEISDLKKEDKFLRLMVEGGGCSGYQYIFKMDDVINSEEDIILEKNNSKVVIDKLSIPFLEGAIIDFKQSMIRSSFSVSENPKADISCSCGSSFSPKL